jgi:hypothetical protein
MNIYTIRLSKKLLLLAGGIVVALFIALILLLTGNDTAPTGAAIDGIRDKWDQVEYLEKLGYTVDQGSRTSKKVTIPQQFDDVYLTYNRLQQECGFDLLHYTGKKVDLVTYSVTNYPTGEDVLADLLLYGDKLIGGAIYTTAVDGFMHGLRPVDK